MISDLSELVKQQNLRISIVLKLHIQYSTLCCRSAVMFEISGLGVKVGGAGDTALLRTGRSR